MTDFRNLRPDHDLRSQLGLKPFDKKAFAEDVCTTLSVDQVCKMSILGEALLFEPKPLDPSLATPEPLRRAIASMGELSLDEVCRMSTPEPLRRAALAVNKLFSSTHTGNQPINVTINADDPVSKDAAEIVTSIRKMIDSPGDQRVRAIGTLSAGPYPKRSIQLEETSMTDMSSQLLFDARRLAELIPPGVILIKGLDPAEYVAQFSPPSGVLQVTYDDIKSVGVLTVAQASVLRGAGLYAVGGYFLGGKTKKAQAPRTLTDILAHIKNLEADVLDALIMANHNPDTDRRRTAAARDQLEMGFMMLKKAVDPE